MRVYRISEEKDLINNAELLSTYINDHKKAVTCEYKPLQDAYNTDYAILHGDKKEAYKPDNRVPVNFAKYIVDTLNGFFLGIPVKVACENNTVSDYINLLDAYNDQDDSNAELGKICSIYGHGFEMYYVDSEGQIAIAALDPMESFMIYDESIESHPRYFIRTYFDNDNEEHGSISDGVNVRYFDVSPSVKFTSEPEIHGFDGVPAVEFLENRERRGAFESVLPLINAYNKAISEKANDVDYFADAYMKVLGAELDESGVRHIRDNRLINFDGDAAGIVVDFLSKPDGDTTQEHLIDRLEKLIFQISMVANISDENFGNSSGIALRYKLQSMSNLAKTKERKFTSGMVRRYRLIFSNPLSGMTNIDGGKAWAGIKYVFTRNYPANVAEEAEIARNLEGVVTVPTQLSVLSIVEDPNKEAKELEAEQVGMLEG